MSDVERTRFEFLGRVAPIEQAHRNALDNLHQVCERLNRGNGSVEIIRVANESELKQRVMEDPGHVYIRAAFGAGILFPVLLGLCPALQAVPEYGLLPAHEAPAGAPRSEIEIMRDQVRSIRMRTAST